jgi:hypothetical protein
VLRRSVETTTNNGQSSALARHASVATIELFWKEKFIWALARRVHQKFYNRPDLLGISGSFSDNPVKPSTRISLG